MAIEIREYIGNHMNISESSSKMFMNLKEGYNTVDPINKDSIMQDIEGIHVGPTRNFTWYMEEALDSSIPSWTKPYQRPLIMHHNEKDGKIIGRVVNAIKLTVNTRSGTPALLFTCNVPDKEGKEQILDGRLKTTSIGVIAHDVRCSICSKQVELDDHGYPECGHVRGNVYNNEACYWQIYKMEAKELSYVIVPSDVYAHNIRTYSPENKDIEVKESLELNEGAVKNMAIEKNLETTTEPVAKVAGKTIDETVKEGTPVADSITTTEDTIKEDKEEPKKEKVEVEELKAELEKIKEDLIKAEAEKANCIKELGDIKISLADATVKVDKAARELGAEVALKESVENELIAVKTELREATVENLNSLRANLNKTIFTTEALESRTFESIKDSIKDLKEELTGLDSVKHITESTDPTLKTTEALEKNKETTELDVKENKTVGNIDLEEGLNKLMAKFLL